MKLAISIFVTVLAIPSYYLYYKDVMKGKTKPHFYTWGLWSLMNIAIIGLQLQGGAGVGVLYLIFVSFLCIGITVLSVTRGHKEFTTTDKCVAAIALVGIAAWLLINQPVLALICIITADLLAFYPTVRKSWLLPESETLSTYLTNGFRFSLAIFAIEKYSFLSVAWTLVWAACNFAFALYLFVRRKSIVR